MRVVFMEGVSGVGKSTMVRALAARLREKGGSVREFVEFDYTNPIDFYCTAIMGRDTYLQLCAQYAAEETELRRNAIFAGENVLVRYYDEDRALFGEGLMAELERMEFCYDPKEPVPIDVYTETYRQVWKGFCDGIDAGVDFYIFDGSLLHHPINDMMRNYDVSFERALEHVRVLLGTMEGIDWQVVYLRTRDMGAQLARALQDRGQEAPNAKAIDFWRARGEKDMFVLENGVARYRIFDVSDNGWAAAQEEILRDLEGEGIMNEKLRVFLELAGKMNRRFSVIPLLYGSMGLQMLVDEDLNPDDIDICVPQHLYHLDAQWPELVKFMLEEGYELVDEHEHFFQKGEIGVNFGVIDGYRPNTIPSIEAFAGIAPEEIPIIQAEGATYRRLTLEQYFKVYSESLKDNYRNREGDEKDKSKVEMLKRIFDCEEQA